MPRRGGASTLPGARAIARYVRVSPRKARRVIDLIRGLPANEALTVLKFAPQAASVPVYKVLASAIANAENNERLDPDSLLVSEAYVDEGPTLTRYRPRAQGRAYRIRKRTCHITVAVESVQVSNRSNRRTRPARDTRRGTQASVSRATAAQAAAEAADEAARTAKADEAAVDTDATETADTDAAVSATVEQTNNDAQSSDDNDEPAANREKSE